MNITTHSMKMHQANVLLKQIISNKCLCSCCPGRQGNEAQPAPLPPLPNDTPPSFPPVGTIIFTFMVTTTSIFFLGLPPKCTSCTLWFKLVRFGLPYKLNHSAHCMYSFVTGCSCSTLWCWDAAGGSECGCSSFVFIAVWSTVKLHGVILISSAINGHSSYFQFQTLVDDTWGMF